MVCWSNDIILTQGASGREYNSPATSFFSHIFMGTFPSRNNSGMILALGARGPEFNSRTSPLFLNIFSCWHFHQKIMGLMACWSNNYCCHSGCKRSREQVTDNLVLFTHIFMGTFPSRNNSLEYYNNWFVGLVAWFSLWVERIRVQFPDKPVILDYLHAEHFHQQIVGCRTVINGLLV